MHAHFDRLESLDELARAAMASPGSDEARRISMPDRLAMFRQLPDSIVPRLAEVDRERIARLLVIHERSEEQLFFLMEVAQDTAQVEIDEIICCSAPFADVGVDACEPCVP